MWEGSEIADHLLFLMPPKKINDGDDHIRRSASPIRPTTDSFVTEASSSNDVGSRLVPEKVKETEITNIRSYPPTKRLIQHSYTTVSASATTVNTVNTVTPSTPNTEGRLFKRSTTSTRRFNAFRKADRPLMLPPSSGFDNIVDRTTTKSSSSSRSSSHHRSLSPALSSSSMTSSHRSDHVLDQSDDTDMDASTRTRNDLVELFAMTDVAEKGPLSLTSSG